MASLTSSCCGESGTGVTALRSGTRAPSAAGTKVAGAAVSVALGAATVAVGAAAAMVAVGPPGVCGEPGTLVGPDTGDGGVGAAPQATNVNSSSSGITIAIM